MLLSLGFFGTYAQSRSIYNETSHIRRKRHTEVSMISTTHKKDMKSEKNKANENEQEQEEEEERNIVSKLVDNRCGW